MSHIINTKLQKIVKKKKKKKITCCKASCCQNIKQKAEHFRIKDLVT